MNQFCVLLQSLFTYAWYVWKYFIHILLTYFQKAAFCIFLHHAVLLVCYWCNMEFIGLAWMVRWEKFTHKTYDLKVLWNNHMSDVYLHDCTSRPHPLHVHLHGFSLLSWSPFLSLTNSCLLSLITMSGSKKHKPGGTRTHCWACNVQTARQHIRMRSMQFLCHTILHSSKGW